MAWWGAARELLVTQLRVLAPGSSIALVELDAARQDLAGVVCFEATLIWVESLVKRAAVEASHVESLVSELTCVGPRYEIRRVAAVLGLAIAGHLERFATAVDDDGGPLAVLRMPEVGFDLVLRSYRLVRQVLLEVVR